MPGQRAPEAERREQILAAALAVSARDRLDGLTMANVAREAGLSKGLVFFHFGDRKQLLLAVLDILIDAVIATDVEPEVLRDTATARDRLLALIRRDADLMPTNAPLIELFFDFWVMGTREPDVRTRIQEALERYRTFFLPYCRSVVDEEPDRFAGTSPERLARLVVAFLTGSAVQTVMDPESYAVDEFMATVEALVPPPGA